MEWFARYYAIDRYDFDALAGMLAEGVRAQTATGVDVVGRHC